MRFAHAALLADSGAVTEVLAEALLGVRVDLLLRVLGFGALDAFARHHGDGLNAVRNVHDQWLLVAVDEYAFNLVRYAVASYVIVPETHQLAVLEARPLDALGQLALEQRAGSFHEVDPVRLRARFVHLLRRARLAAVVVVASPVVCVVLLRILPDALDAIVHLSSYSLLIAF